MSKAKSLFLLVVLTCLLLPASANTVPCIPDQSPKSSTHQQPKQSSVDWCCAARLSCCVNNRNAR
jgi:hypothetical protein